MKTKFVVALTGAVAFFAASNVQAYFDPSIGRWASRDPIQERGGLNLYALVNNDSINKVDYVGLKPNSQCQLANGALLLSFVFDGTSLSGSSLSLPAASGRPVKVNVTSRWVDYQQSYTWFGHNEDVSFDYSVERQKIRDVGPIPEGKYYIENCEERCAWTSPKSHILEMSAWGSYSWSLHSEIGTETYGRSGFFIHGGNRWGSAGCIDVEHGDEALHNLFKGIGNTGCCYIPVEVKYVVQQATLTDSVLDYMLGPINGF